MTQLLVTLVLYRMRVFLKKLNWAGAPCAVGLNGKKTSGRRKSFLLDSLYGTHRELYKSARPLALGYACGRLLSHPPRPATSRARIRVLGPIYFHACCTS
jgi:hypothetical protein